jgi:hypothetical protein
MLNILVESNAAEMFLLKLLLAEREAGLVELRVYPIRFPWFSAVSYAALRYLKGC